MKTKNEAKGNKKRHWGIYDDLAQVLMAKEKKREEEEDMGLELKNTIYALD